MVDWLLYQPIGGFDDRKNSSLGLEKTLDSLTNANACAVVKRIKRASLAHW